MKKKSIVTVVNDFLYRIEKEVCWVAFLVMLILLVVQVACRYVLKMPLAWSEELARFVYVSVSFLGASIAIRESSHITINLLPSILRKFQKDEQKQAGVLKYFDVLAYIVGAAFWIYITKGTLDYVIELKTKEMLSVAMEWPMWIVFLPVFVCGVFMVIHYLLNIAEKFAVRPDAAAGTVSGEEAPQ